MMRVPEKVRGYRSAVINALIDCVRQLQPLSSATISQTSSLDGTKSEVRRQRKLETKIRQPFDLYFLSNNHWQIECPFPAAWLGCFPIMSGDGIFSYNYPDTTTNLSLIDARGGIAPTRWVFDSGTISDDTKQCVYLAIQFSVPDPTTPTIEAVAAASFPTSGSHNPNTEYVPLWYFPWVDSQIDVTEIWDLRTSVRSSYVAAGALEKALLATGGASAGSWTHSGQTLSWRNGGNITGLT